MCTWTPAHSAAHSGHEHAKQQIIVFFSTTKKAKCEKIYIVFKIAHISLLLQQAIGVLPDSPYTVCMLRIVNLFIIHIFALRNEHRLNMYGSINMNMNCSIYVNIYTPSL